MALVLAALMAALFALQAGGTAPAPMRHRGDTDGQVADAPKPRVPKSAPNAAKPELPPLKEPPPKPATRNDPATNKVWFRLLDAETNRPIVNTPATFASFYTYDERVWWRASNSFGDAKTNAEGLFVGTYRDYSRQPSSEPKPGEPPLPDDADLQVSEGDLLNCPYPLAKNYEPETSTEELQLPLLAFAHGKYAEIIDVRLRKMRKVTGTVVDANGKPVPGAGVFAVPHRGHQNDAFLQEWSYYYMDIPPNDEAWERPGTRTAKIIQRQFEDERPTISAIKGAAIEPRGEHSRPDRFRYTAASKWATFWTETSGAQGRFEIAELPRGEWVLGAWHPAHGFITQLITLIQSDGEVSLALPNDKTASVDLIIDWVGEPPPEKLNISVSAADPYGRSLGHGISATRECTPSGSGPWHFTIEGLREGIWVFDAEHCAQALALKSGAREGLNLRCGKGVLGKWRARIFGSTAMTEHVRVQSTSGLRLIDSHDGTTLHGITDDDWRLLPEGDYEASIAGAPAMRFSIVPGCELETELSVVLSTVAFSISAELAQILGGENEAIDLTLEPADDALPYPGENPPGLAAVFAHVLDAKIEDGPEDDFSITDLAPGRINNWQIPRGVYHWTLRGRRDAVGGTVDLRAQSRVEFSLSNLPGMAVLSWVLSDEQSRTECRAAVTYNLVQTLDDISDVGEVNEKCWTLESERQFLWATDDRTMFLVAPPGRHVVSFASGDNDVNRILEFPGTVRLLPREFAAWQPSAVRLDYTNGSHEYSSAMAIAPDGSYDFLQIDRTTKAEFFLRDGPWTLYVLRLQPRNASNEPRSFEWAVFSLVVAGCDQTIELDSGSYVPYGSLRLELSGKALVGEQRDPWWLDNTEIGIRALDIGAGGICAMGALMPRALWSRELSLKPRKGSGKLAVPPGRYKIIPWPGAPESACKIVTVEPGIECVVRFEGR